MMRKPYNHRNCQSLFGYAAAAHRRSGGRCALCGCGGEPLQFDIWRQMTVEHLIGKSQKGYLNDIRGLIQARFPELPESKQEDLSRQIDALNTVTCCSFCNSTTSRDKSPKSMAELIAAPGEPTNLLYVIASEVELILERKRQDVAWKLKSMREAFEREFPVPSSTRS
jgi:hypothetical protein